MNRAVFLDRDGTLIRDCHYISDPKHIYVYKNVIPALKELKKKGWKLIIGTNQSGIARGYLGLETLKSIHDKLLSVFKKNGLRIDEIAFCPHHPEDNCQCRKPRTAMLTASAKKHGLDLKKCIVVGDKESDILWGRNAHARTVLVLTGRGRKTLRDSKVKANHVSSTFSGAADWILNHG